MASENYVNLYYSDEKIRLTILTNMCRRLVILGYLDSEKYKPVAVTGKASTEKDIRKIVVEQPSVNDKIDNSLFLPFIETRTDNNIYIIPLDNPYKDERATKSTGQFEFDGYSVVIKLIPQTVKDISSSPLLSDFLESYNKYHKIVVIDGMSPKVYVGINKKKNSEIFTKSHFMIDLMSHFEAPERCDFIDSSDIGYIANQKNSKIHENDPLCMYYNGKNGMIMRIVRRSHNNSKEIGYRKVIGPNFNFI